MHEKEAGCWQEESQQQLVLSAPGNLTHNSSYLLLPLTILMASWLITLLPLAFTFTTPSTWNSPQTLSLASVFRADGRGGCATVRAARISQPAACVLGLGDSAYVVAELREEHSRYTRRGWESLASRTWEMFLNELWNFPPPSPEWVSWEYPDRSSILMFLLVCDPHPGVPFTDSDADLMSYQFSSCTKVQ